RTIFTPSMHFITYQIVYITKPSHKNCCNTEWIIVELVLCILVHDLFQQEDIPCTTLIVGMHQITETHKNPIHTPSHLPINQKKIKIKKIKIKNEKKKIHN